MPFMSRFFAIFLLALGATAAAQPTTRPAINHPASVAYSDFLLLAMEDPAKAANGVVIEDWQPEAEAADVDPEEPGVQPGPDLPEAVAMWHAGHTRFYSVMRHHFGTEPVADAAEAVKAVRGMAPARRVEGADGRVVELLYVPEGVVFATMKLGDDGEWRLTYTTEQVRRELAETPPPPSDAQLPVALFGYGVAYWQTAEMVGNGRLDTEEEAEDFLYASFQRMDELLELELDGVAPDFGRE